VKLRALIHFAAGLKLKFAVREVPEATAVVMIHRQRDKVTPPAAAPPLFVISAALVKVFPPQVTLV
jgi:hypothetical protein